MQDKGYKEDVEAMAEFFQKLSDKANSYERVDTPKKGETDFNCVFYNLLYFYKVV